MIFSMSAIHRFAEIVIDQSEICGPGALPCRGVGGDNVQNAIQIAFAIAGSIAVIIIIIAGFRYILSSGDPQEAAKAKNTILYALIGLVVIVLGSAIVRFVINRI